MKCARRVQWCGGAAMESTSEKGPLRRLVVRKVGSKNPRPQAGVCCVPAWGALCRAWPRRRRARGRMRCVALVWIKSAMGGAGGGAGRIATLKRSGASPRRAWQA